MDSCTCILCVIRQRVDAENAPTEMTIADFERELEEDTTDCNAREHGDQCGGCGRCRRMQYAHYGHERLNLQGPP